MKIVKKIKRRFEGFGHGLLYNTTGYVTLRGKYVNAILSWEKRAETLLKELIKRFYFWQRNGEKEKEVF